jgi:hypothetical protein
LVVQSAGVAVVTQVDVRREGTSLITIACVRGAGVSVVTDDALSGFTESIRAPISEGTIVFIVANQGVPRVYTANAGVTAVVCAELEIIAHDRGTNACPCATYVISGAFISVIATRDVYWIMDTVEGTWVTGVICTWILIVTREFIDLSITVVVHTVTDLRTRSWGRARPHAFFSTNPWSDAASEFVGLLTVRAVSIFNREQRAFADAIDGDA